MILHSDKFFLAVNLKSYQTLNLNSLVLTFEDKQSFQQLQEASISFDGKP